jgi:hypothetical protein
VVAGPRRSDVGFVVLSGSVKAPYHHAGMRDLRHRPRSPVAAGPDAPSRLRLRHGSWILVVMNGGKATARIMGAGHRRPSAVPVPMRLAARLAARGLPLVIRRRDPRELGDK